MKYYFFLSVIVTSLSASGLDTIKYKSYKNEFGVDATEFIKQFLNFDSQSSNYYTTVYYLTYRRHCKYGNIRAGFGGTYSDYDIITSSTDDTNKYHYNSYAVNTRLGWEFSDNLSKRWQVFYGADIRASASYLKNDAPHWNGGYANGVETKTSRYSIVPLLGFRFRFNNRISISTETGYAINWQKESYRRYFISTSSQFPPMQDIIKPDAKKINTTFLPPISLFLTFDI